MLLAVGSVAWVQLRPPIEERICDRLAISKRLEYVGRRFLQDGGSIVNVFVIDRHELLTLAIAARDQESNPPRALWISMTDIGAVRVQSGEPVIARVLDIISSRAKVSPELDVEVDERASDRTYNELIQLLIAMEQGSKTETANP